MKEKESEFKRVSYIQKRGREREKDQKRSKYYMREREKVNSELYMKEREVENSEEQGVITSCDA